MFPRKGLTMPSPKKAKLLACARHLFETEGFHTTGIDRILDEAGVAKMTLYNNFGSKDMLIVAVLNDASSDMINQLQDAIAHINDPYEQILGVFDALADWHSSDKFCGCMFQAAVAEFPDPNSAPAIAAREHLLRLHTLFQEMCQRAELNSPEVLGSMLSMLASGANCTARQIRTRVPADQARQIAEILLERACARPGQATHPIAPASRTESVF
ncbi:MAG: TetR family transcriptional regulator [Phycisphaerae bacterium]|nr:TetR family transcriptional regulator [Phycisphaerae bacterium]MBM91363.1 TetR family transcriptional regulator [Phycisphaerae bacterium]